MRAVFLLFSLALAACASAPNQAAIEGPYYPEGYSDGCRTAEALRAPFDTRSYKNDALFDAQPSYQAGFQAGLVQCQRIGIDGVRPTVTGQQDDTF
jgi:hypothetical protein